MSDPRIHVLFSALYISLRYLFRSIEALNDGMLTENDSKLVKVLHILPTIYDFREITSQHLALAANLEHQKRPNLILQIYSHLMPHKALVRMN